MKTIGIDIGTTTISGVVMENKTAEKARTLEAKTIENGSFITTANEWEKIQDAEQIVSKALGLLDYFLDKYPDVQKIGLTGQMHGIVYIDKDGKCASPLYTWQDARGSLCGENGISLTEEIQEKCKVKTASGYGMVTHIYNLRHGLISKSAVTFCTIMDFWHAFERAKNTAGPRQQCSKLQPFRRPQNVLRDRETSKNGSRREVASKSMYRN